MKLLRQILTGVAVLAIAIMIVDCSENLHEAFDEQISKLVAEQPSVAEASKVEYASETQLKGPKCRAEEKDSVTEIPKETTETSQGPDASNKEARDKKDVETKATKKEQDSDKQAPKPNKYQVYTITIPDDPSAEVLVEKSSAGQKPAEKHDEPASSSDPVPVDSRANTKHLNNQKAAGDTQAEEASRQEEKPAKDQLNGKINKADKKMKGKSTKRDKRETKKSGSGKNGKTKRSAEKSKKYESKKKSKK